MLSHATLLRDEAVNLAVSPSREGGSPGSGDPVSLRLYGTNFCWPMRSRNPVYDAVTDEIVDVLIAHGPVKGYADGGKGCDELLRLCQRLRPRLVVGGHIHFAHGVEA